MTLRPRSPTIAFDVDAAAPAVPFDEGALLAGEAAAAPELHGAGGVAVADAFAPAWGGRNRPVQVTITNYRLLLRQPAGTGATLHVTLCSGHGLKPCDKNGFSDPYAVLHVTGHRTQQVPKRTPVKHKTLDPVWNETFVFENVDAAAKLHVALYDEDKFSKDDFMGEAEVCNLAEGKGQFSERLDVLLGNVKNGSLRLRISCMQPQPGAALRHCSIPLLCIEEVRLSSSNTLEILTKLADQIFLRFDDARLAALAFKKLSDSPSVVVAGSPFSFAFCFAAVLASSPAHELQGEQPQGAPPASTFHEAVDGPQSDQDSDPYSFSLVAELQRWTRAHDGAGEQWRVDSTLNAEYRVCATYPREVILPASLSREEVLASASFRIKDRFPYVAWLHPGNGAALVRCSQPRTSLGRGKAAAAAEDCSRLMKFASPDCQELTICDARPFVNAEANRFKGGGTEDSNYAGCHVEFLNVDNIHEMAKSLANFRKGMSQQEDHASCASAVSGWLGHLGAVIKGAGFAASVMESGESVVVHCSDGWDRTSQIVCLTSLLLDGHYRTIQGFPDLIVKDWLLPGHRFAHRNGLAARKEQRSHQDALSPIFLQFVDCVAQVWTVYPHFFQYSIQLLAFVLYHSYSGRYSTFLGNCQGEREQLRADRGPCLWTELLSDQGRWKNPLYDPRTARACIVPCVVPPRRLAFCAELYSSLGGLFAEDVDVGSWARRASRQASLLADFTPCRRPSRPAACSSGARTFFCGPGGDPARTGEPSTLLTIAESALRRFLCVDDSFAQAPTVSVADCAEHSDHTEFVIAVRAAGRTLEVRRRFSEFDKLAHDLQAAGMAFTEPFPRKTLGRCRGGSLVQRRQRLDSWLLAVLAEARALEA